MCGRRLLYNNSRTWISYTISFDILCNNTAIIFMAPVDTVSKHYLLSDTEIVGDKILKIYKESRTGKTVKTDKEPQAAEMFNKSHYSLSVDRHEISFEQNIRIEYKVFEIKKIGSL